MKATLFVFLIIFSFNTLGQSVFYDADTLKQWSEVQFDIATIKVDTNNGEKVLRILYSYLSDSQKTVIDTSSTVIQKLYFIESFYKENPFLTTSGTAEVTPNLDGLTFQTQTRDLFKSLGGLNVTTFADGLAQFMIERANEEINVWFFRKFKEDLHKSIELRTIFPLTNSFIQITEPYQYAQNLHLLREAFKKDISDIIGNLEDLANLEKYRRVFEKSDELKIVLVGLAGASIVSKIKNGTHPADVIDSLGQKQYLSSINNNLLSSLVLFSTLSQSFRSTDGNVAYIPAVKFKDDILSDPIAFRIYLGLLYQQLNNVGFTNKGQTITIGQFLTNEKDKILQSNSIGLGLLEKLNIVDDNFKKIKDKSDTVEIKYLEWYNFYGSIIDLVEFGMEVPKILPITNEEAYLYKAAGAKKFIYSARQGNEIFRNVNEKNYSLAVMNFSILYDTMIYRPIRTNQKKIDKQISNDINQLSGKKDAEKALYLLGIFDNSYSLNVESDSLMKDGVTVDYKIALKQYYGNKKIDDALVEYKKQTEEYSIQSSKFIKYGAFMAAVADAEKPEDVKAALNAAALPAGSSSIKRQTPFNVSVNSYLGFHLGEEKLDGKGWGNIQGVSAPVGIAASLRLNKPFNGGSISLFGSVIDIGAVASFRLTNDAGVETLPEMKLQNIIAPGAYIIYGIPNAPISIGYGWQRGPQLRGLATTTSVEGEPAAVTFDMVNGYRWTFFIAMDIPLFNLYTKSK